MKSATLIVNYPGWSHLEDLFSSVEGGIMSKAFPKPPRKLRQGVVWHGQWVTNEYLGDVLSRLRAVLNGAKGQLWHCVSVDQEDEVFVDGNWDDSPLTWRKEISVHVGNRGSRGSVSWD